MEPEIDDAIVGRTYGDYPWDHLKTAALAAGLSESMAWGLREVMREAYNHGWSETLRVECGLRDAGAALIARAQSQPAELEERLQWLIETDGQRTHPITMDYLGENHPMWFAHLVEWKAARAKRKAAKDAESGEP